ncbi:MAG TPA: serine/threonine-protein kinase, partial [Polyangiaceae bacterium]|nr:serine/threonine-protein kinase [Polyangiaceae bacterium]
VRGESLSTLLDLAQARLSYELAAAITRDVLYGLQAVHEARDDNGTPLGIVHRDVSPHNVLVGADGTARVSDFGIAKAVSRFQITRAGQVKGKPRYMAPEQLRGQPVQPAADLYATGVVLWELLVGEPLFDARDEAQLYGLVLEGRINAPRELVADIPAELDALVMRALSRDPAARFATAREMASALERAIRPASSDEVGAWVRELVGERLERRAQLFEGAEPSGVKARAATHTAVPEAGATSTALSRETTTVTFQPSVAPAPRRRWWWLVAALPMAGAMGFGAVWVTSPRSVRVQSGIVPRAEAGAQQTTALSAAPTTTVIDVPPEVFSADKPKPRATTPPPVRKPNCNPPYIEDETGFRRIKRECL